MHEQQHGPSTIMQEVLANGNIPVAGRGRNGMMAGGGGVIPPVLLDETRVPRFYHEAIIACGATNSNMLPHTALVYNMMVTSGLPRHILSYIWSAVNRTLPGQLTRAEFYSCLALIALAQKGESIAALSNSSQLPIPHLQTVQVPVQQNPAMVLVAGQQQPAARPTQPQKTTASRFIPTSLLSRLRPSEPKKEIDLIGDFAPSSSQTATTSKEEMAVATASSPENKDPEPSASGPNYDLSDVDWDNVGSSFGDSGNSTSGPLSELRTSPAPPQCSIKLANWEEAIRAASKLFKDCENALGKSGDDVLTEVFETEKGTIYLRSLHAVSSILSRIVKTSAGTLPMELREKLDFCSRTWNRYSKFSRPEENQEEANSTTNPPSTCPICQDIVLQCSVEFGTRTYHSTCANLWLNCIRPVLP